MVNTNTQVFDFSLIMKAHEKAEKIITMEQMIPC